MLCSRLQNAWNGYAIWMQSRNRRRSWTEQLSADTPGPRTARGPRAWAHDGPRPGPRTGDARNKVDQAYEQPADGTRTARGRPTDRLANGPRTARGKKAHGKPADKRPADMGPRTARGQAHAQAHGRAMVGDVRRWTGDAADTCKRLADGDGHRHKDGPADKPAERRTGLQTTDGQATYGNEPADGPRQLTDSPRTSPRTARAQARVKPAVRYEAWSRKPSALYVRRISANRSDSRRSPL